VRCSCANENRCAGENTDSLSNTETNHLDSSCRAAGYRECHSTTQSPRQTKNIFVGRLYPPVILCEHPRRPPSVRNS
jgi:hypothetical protein